MLAMGMEPDPWQRTVLANTTDWQLLCCSRQAGKTTTSGTLGYCHARDNRNAMALILAPTYRQSGELFRKVLSIHDRLGCKAVERTKTWLTLENGSRIIALPEREETIRGYSGVTLLIVDEAAIVGDDTYKAVRPMLAASGGRLVAMSTPRGKRGWFYQAWAKEQYWRKTMVTAHDVPRIPREFLERERESLGPRFFSQEYECNFEGGAGMLLPFELIQKCEDVSSLWPRGEPVRGALVGPLYVGIDLGRSEEAKAGRTVVWTWELVDGILWARDICVLHGKSWDEQEHEIGKRLGRPTVVKARIDAGFGGQIVERLTRSYPKLEGAHLNEHNMGSLANGIKIGFESRRVRIPIDHVLRDDLQLVEETVQQNGKPKIETKNSASGHADRFWAAALGYDAAQVHRPTVTRRPIYEMG